MGPKVSYGHDIIKKVSHFEYPSSIISMDRNLEPALPGGGFLPSVINTRVNVSFLSGFPLYTEADGDPPPPSNSTVMVSRKRRPASMLSRRLVGRSSMQLSAVLKELGAGCRWQMNHNEGWAKAY
ncbi:unnamed protein product [Soboliphyme baturini]|uniref:Uncharacterized protein n=1 Tax=Soboliphyme baturini TaxID=241478 RepID=A0A183IFJ3_9BILA|nr:unnamed protein product [Soboliphyme baturini]